MGKLRGLMDFGKSSRLHMAKIIRRSMNLPLAIVIVDYEERMNEFLPALDPMMGDGLAMLKRSRSSRIAARQKRINQPIPGCTNKDKNQDCLTLIPAFRLVA